MTEITLNQIDNAMLKLRRLALDNKRYNIMFAAGWFVYDEKDLHAELRAARTMEEALDLAEALNEEGTP